MTEERIPLSLIETSSLYDEDPISAEAEQRLANLEDQHFISDLFF